MAKPICIIGCGSSGTKYITKVLKRAGILIGHERMGPHGMSSWYATAGPDADKRPPYNGTPFSAFRKRFGDDPVIFHQLRHPLKTISTVQRYSKPSWRYIYHYCPEITPDKPLVLRCMLYWYHWSKMAEGLAEWRYRVEELPQVFRQWCQRLGRPELIRLRNYMLAESTRVNSRRQKYRPLSWSDLRRYDIDLTRRIKSLGREYGYSLS